MKRARVLLWLVFALICMVSILLFTRNIGVFDRSNQAKFTQGAASTSPPAQELAAAVTAETPQPEKLDVLDPTVQDSSHAIVPDTPLVPAPSPPTEATAPNADLPTSQATAPSADPAVKEASPPITSQPSAPAHAPSPTMPKDELVTITSAAILRNGPSSSANIIGRAHAGAKGRVAATNSGWAQIVDPASGNKGWVESKFLAPSATTETAAIDAMPNVAAPDTLPEDQRAAMSENPPSATRSEHSAKAKRHRGKHHHARRRFAFRFVIRGFLR
jgi:hypothetical protein